MTTSDAESDAKARRHAQRLARRNSIAGFSWTLPLACFALSLAMHLPFLGMTPLAGTEGHRVFPAHEMVRTHWAYVPILFNKPFMTKPPLHHWLIAASEILGGKRTAAGDIDATPRNLFVWRLPSALAGAALAAAACIFGARWFGNMAGGISGVCAAGMIAIWGQSQVADIDASNTLATALAALCGIELLIVRPQNPRRWIVGAGLAIGATLMIKGPAGLPLLVGVWLYGAMAGRQWAARWGIVDERGPCRANRLWIPWLIGIAIFALYALVAWYGLKHRGLPIDFSGLKEGSKRLHPNSTREFSKAMATMLPQLFAFALPMSLAMLFLLDREVRAVLQPRELQLATALAGSLLLSWAVCVLSGMTNPRYGYPTLIVLCPLTGALAVAAAKTRRPGDWLRGSGMVMGAVLALTTVVLGIWAFRDRQHLDPHGPWNVPHFGWIVAGAGAAALVVGAWTFYRLNRFWDGAWGLVVLLLLAAIPFGFQRCVARTAISGINTAVDLRRMIGPDTTVLAASGAVTSKPETFYYAHVRVNFTTDPKNFLPANVSAGTWVVYDENERRKWKDQPGVLLEHESHLCKNGDMNYYVVWYVEPGTKATREGGAATGKDSSR